MMKNVNIKSVLNIYDNEISKNVKNKNKLFMFEKNKMQIISEITDILQDGCYDGGHYNIFLIREPKHRIIMSLNIKDKIINHYITRNILEYRLTKYLDNRNIATRKNMGTDYGIRLLKKYIELNKKYSKFYILKIDISKYFYSIDHNVLQNLLVDKLDLNEYKLICKVIDSTNKVYINEQIKNIKEKYSNKHPQFKKEVFNLPYYDYGKGLPIGNMTSQFLSIFYLYKLDYYIVNNLHLKYYVRYMDDFIILHNDKKVLEKALEDITQILYKDYKLKINIKKTRIFSSKEGFTFLGYVFKVYNKKTIMKMRKQSYEKIKQKVKTVSYLYNNKKIHLNNAFSSIMTYYNKKHGNIMKIRRIINKYWFENFKE